MEKERAMDARTFWLIALALISLTGSILTVARRYGNSDLDPYAGSGIAGWTIVLFVLLLFFGIDLLK